MEMSVKRSSKLKILIAVKTGGSLRIHQVKTNTICDLVSFVQMIPNRGTHHVIVLKNNQQELIALLACSSVFSMNKKSEVLILKI